MRDRDRVKTFYLPDDEIARFNKLIPRGLTTQLFQWITRDLLDAMERTDVRDAILAHTLREMNARPNIIDKGGLRHDNFSEEASKNQSDPV